MRRLAFGLFLAAGVTCAAPSRAAQPDLSSWFARATGYGKSITAATLAAPDFLGGTTLDAQEHALYVHPDRRQPVWMGMWQLLAYDRTHHIGLARATTDQSSIAVFTATSPRVEVKDRDLSTFSTGKGIHVGSRYSAVVKAYGKPAVPYSHHFIAAYDSKVPQTTMTIPHKKAMLPLTLMFTIDNDRVTSALSTVGLGGLF
jgi:hypothetical protein